MARKLSYTVHTQFFNCLSLQHRVIIRTVATEFTNFALILSENPFQKLVHRVDHMFWVAQKLMYKRVCKNEGFTMLE